MKLTLHMYHLSTFHFQKNEGVNERLAESVSKYLPKNAMKFRKLPQFCCIFHQFMDQVSTNNKVSTTQHGKVGKFGCVKQRSEG